MKQWHEITLPYPRNTRARIRYVAYARKLQHAMRHDKNSRAILTELDVFLRDSGSLPEHHQCKYRAALLVITDLALQLWNLRTNRRGEVFASPPEVGDDRAAEKKAIRAQELVKRDAQLRQPSVRKFVESMERKRLFEDRFVSVFDLMRDGAELADQLRCSRDTPANGDATADVVKPYIQFVTAKERCSHTGLRLRDIWRYFRHTWVNQYTSVPGRCVTMLIRDAGAPNHPIMGIASISSPIIQISERDKWIGWHPTSFIERLKNEPSAKLARWLCTTVDDAIDEIYKADFLKQKLISRRRLTRPTDDDVIKLRAYAQQQKLRHRRLGQRTDFSAGNGKQVTKHWVGQARTLLFCGKRADSLASLLEIRKRLQAHFGARFTAKKLRALAETASGRRIISKIVRKAKADRVGVAMADISVCGAVQPYNAILGGKLVSMLAASPAVVAEYRRRYLDASSQIASSMAGRPIVRDPALVYLGTTSLYGNGSSQYNRIKVPTSIFGRDSDSQLRFENLGQSESFGTSHFSDETVDALVQCLRQSTNGERVNSIFGEGVSPRLRKMRAGLDLLDFPSDALLQHGRRRTVYGVLLASNARDFLLGIDKRPRYPFLVGDHNAADSVVSWWRHRWLSERIKSDSVLEQVAQHHHVYPLCHGARVAQESLETDERVDGV